MSHRTPQSFQVTAKLITMGFPTGFAELVGEQLNTDFTARQMLGYLRDANPHTAEEVADEMLDILEFRDRCQQKQINKKRHITIQD